MSKITRCFNIAKLVLLLLAIGGFTLWLHRARYNHLLADSVQLNNYAGVIRALRHGADPNMVIGHYPSASSLLDKVDRFIEDTSEPRPLFFDATVAAAETNDLRILKALISCGADPNIHVISSVRGMSNLDCFPITYNCFEEGGLNWDVVRTLVDAGANVRVNSSAILWSAARERNCLMAAWLLDRGADVTGGGSNFALENAVENLDVEMIRLLLSRGARFSTFQSWMSDGPKSWLELAATCRSQYPKQWREVTAIINSQSPTPSDADDTRGKTNEFEPRPRMPI